MPINKVVDTFDEAVSDIADGSIVHIGGFGGPAEYPSYLIAALARKNVTGLTITGNHSGFGEAQLVGMKERMADLLRYPDDYFTPGLLVERGQVRKGILAFPVLPSTRMELPFERLLKEGKVELELIGQGSLAERIRAARAGIAAFYTPVGPAPWSPTARTSAGSTADPTSSSEPSKPTCRSSGPTRPTVGATSSTGERPARSTPPWPAPPKSPSPKSTRWSSLEPSTRSASSRRLLTSNGSSPVLRRG